MDNATDLQTDDRSTVERVLRAAFKAGASDVHFKAGERVLLRIRGKLQPLNSPALKPDDTLRLLRSLLPAQLGEEDLGKIRDLDFSYAIGGVGRFRVNAFRQRSSVAIVVRVIPLDVLRLGDLNLPPVISQRLLPRASGSGLVPAVEVMVATRYVQDCIRQAEKTQLLNEYIAEGKNYGMQTFDQCLHRMLREGIIAKGVALSAATSPADLDLQIRMGTDEDEEIEVDHHMWDEAARQNDLKHQGELEQEAIDELPESLFDDEKPDDTPGVES